MELLRRHKAVQLLQLLVEFVVFDAGQMSQASLDLVVSAVKSAQIVEFIANFVDEDVCR